MTSSTHTAPLPLREVARRTSAGLVVVGTLTDTVTRLKTAPRLVTGRRRMPFVTRTEGGFGAPTVIGRDHLDAGSVASPEYETEAMRDGSDAIADWPAGAQRAAQPGSGASWVSVHHGDRSGSASRSTRASSWSRRAARSRGAAASWCSPTTQRAGDPPRRRRYEMTLETARGRRTDATQARPAWQH
jgi:hypothetical protein